MNETKYIYKYNDKVVKTLHFINIKYQNMLTNRMEIRIAPHKVQVGSKFWLHF